MKLYKYLGPDIVSKVFLSNKHVSLKCSYPKDFNDPYELFLTIDFNEQPEILAFYSEVVGEIPQRPTTCFSRSPSVVPMWSHYAQNLQGFVIELDEEKLASHFSESMIQDVDYQNEPKDSIKTVLHYAYVSAKGRHIYLLLQEVFHAAYFTKQSCWNYELERRMVIDPKETRKSEGRVLIDISPECVSAIICGPNAKIKTKETLHAKAESIGCSYFEMKIGRSSSTPFFVDFDGDPYIFTEELSVPQKYCANCKEPLYEEIDKCSWCMIEESHKLAAAERNIFRMYDRFGLLESYFDGIEKNSRSHKKK